MVARLADLGAKHELLLAGLGWGSMPKPMVAEDIKRGRLVRLSIDAPAVQRRAALLREAGAALAEKVGRVYARARPARGRPY